MLNNTIQSPLLDNIDAKLIESIKTRELIIGYQKEFSIDVEKYFKGYDEIGVYECEITKYKFYYPYDIYGDSQFYQSLEKFEWYYMSWKWENEKTLNLLKGDEKILEVGSGGLGFIEKLKNSNFNITGLELNEQSIINAKKLNLNVLNESIEEHSISHMKMYDVVCSYQVMEHITAVKPFIKSQLDCLKKGGKLIISVPNNSSYIKLTPLFLLNSPPHHMGLWDENSLKNLTEIFDMKLEDVYFEPLQDYHINSYVNLTAKKLIKKNRVFRVLLKKLKLISLYRQLIKMFRKTIHGHTVMVVYSKN